MAVRGVGTKPSLDCVASILGDLGRKTGFAVKRDDLVKELALFGATSDEADALIKTGLLMGVLSEADGWIQRRR